MAVTVLGPGGYSQPPYGSFAGKPFGGGKVYTQNFSVLGPGGYPRPPYGAFSGKTPSVVGGAQFTVSGPTAQDLFYPPSGVSHTWAAVSKRTV